MASAEWITSTLYDDTDSNSITLFNSRVFDPRVPRGAEASLKYATITWGPDDGTGLTGDITNFMGLVKGTQWNNKTITTAEIIASKIVMESIIIQRAEGSVTTDFTAAAVPSVSRNFERDKSDVGEIKVRGRDSLEENGWGIMWWALGQALNITYLASITWTLRYFNGKGNPRPLSRRWKVQVMNQ